MRVTITNDIRTPGNEGCVIEAGKNRVTFNPGFAIKDNFYFNADDLERFVFPLESPFSSIFDIGNELAWKSIANYEFKAKDDLIIMRGTMPVRNGPRITISTSNLDVISLTEDIVGSIDQSTKFYDQPYVRSIIDSINNKIALKLISNGSIPIGSICAPCLIITDNEDIVNASGIMAFTSASQNVFCTFQKNGSYSKLPLEVREHCRLMLASGNKTLLIPTIPVNLSDSDATVRVDIINGKAVQTTSLSEKLRKASAEIISGTAKPDLTEKDIMPEEYGEEFTFYANLL